jgi:hypothetical protein
MILFKEKQLYYLLINYKIFKMIKIYLDIFLELFFLLFFYIFIKNINFYYIYKHMSNQSTLECIEILFKFFNSNL